MMKNIISVLLWFGVSVLPVRASEIVELNKIKATPIEFIKYITTDELEKFEFKEQVKDFFDQGFLNENPYEYVSDVWINKLLKCGKQFKLDFTECTSNKQIHIL